MTVEAIAAQVLIRILEKEGEIGSALAEIVIDTLRSIDRKEEFSDKIE